ncbi:MAG TPA: DinB family protein [Candidatus Limnocylindria bacterium]|nr:DinB family protein [Candidatus Limnocylindria bacterium]
MTELLRYDEDTAFTLADDAATVSALVRRTDPARLASTRFGEWTAVQLIAHVADSAEIFAERVRRCVEEDQPAISSFDPDARMAELVGTGTLDPMDLSRRLQRAHQAIVQAMQRPGAAERTGVHSDWGHVPASHFAAYQARHSHEHVVELAAAFPPA